MEHGEYVIDQVSFLQIPHIFTSKFPTAKII